MTTALIDGDIVIYSVGFVAEGRYYAVPSAGTYTTFQYSSDAKKFCKDNDIDISLIELGINPDPVEYVYHSLNTMISSIIEAVGAESYQVVISGKNNFRYDVDPNYKANRKDAPKPYHYEEMVDFLQQYHNGIIIDGMEADDYMGIEQSASRQLSDSVLRSDTVICSTDKDLKQIVGWNYNWGREELRYIEEDEAHHFFWVQMLTGDTIDNIPGVPGIGPKRAEKLLLEERDPACIVGLQYAIHFDDPETRFEQNTQLLGIKTHASG